MNLKKNKKNIIICIMIILSITVIIESISLIVLLNQDQSDIQKEKEKENFELYKEDVTNEYPKITKFFKSSSTFKNSKIEEDRKNEKLILDDKYQIGLREGYIYLNIDYDENIEDYCKIVESIEEGLNSRSNYHEACLLALGGSITNDYMQVSYEQNGLFVLLNTKTAMEFEEATFYDLGEKIELESRNFGIKFDEYSLTNTSSGFNDFTHSTNVCFTVVNNDKTPRDFTVKYFDENDSLLHEEKYSYKGEDLPAEHICLNYENDNVVKKFSIN